MVELDPDKREWEYDGDGKKIYKLEAGKPTKTEWIEWRKVKPYSKKVNDVDLDGGVPFKKDWVAESNEITKKVNGD